MYTKVQRSLKVSERLVNLVGLKWYIVPTIDGGMTAAQVMKTFPLSLDDMMPSQ